MTPGLSGLARTVGIALMAGDAGIRDPTIAPPSQETTDLRTHYTNMDTFERVREQDMKQSAIVFASFAWQASIRDRVRRLPGTR